MYYSYNPHVSEITQYPKLIKTSVYRYPKLNIKIYIYKSIKKLYFDDKKNSHWRFN